MRIRNIFSGGLQRGFRDEITFVAPGGTEAMGISLCDSREQADAYNSSEYSEVLKELNKLVEGTPGQNLRCPQFDAAQHRSSTRSVIVGCVGTDTKIAVRRGRN